MFCIRFCSVLFISLLTAAGFAAPLRAQTGATGKVRMVLDRAMVIQTRPGLQGPQHRKERAVLIRKLISENFLSSEMARASLPGYWGKISARQRERYKSLFKAIFIDSYTRQVLDFLKKEKIKYAGETPDGSYTKVNTVIMRTDEHIPVGYVLERKGPNWMIRNVIIDGVGMIETYRNGFEQFLRSHPFDSLIRRMTIQEQSG